MVPLKFPHAFLGISCTDKDVYSQFRSVGFSIIVLFNNVVPYNFKKQIQLDSYLLNKTFLPVATLLCVCMCVDTWPLHLCICCPHNKCVRENL